MSFELIVLGCGGSGPSPQGPASGYLVRTETTSLWLDAGTGTFMALTEWIDPVDLDAVVISHLHADHSVDVFGLLHYLAYRVGKVEGLPLLLPEGAIATLAAFLGADSGHDLFATLAPREVDADDIVEVGDLTLRFARSAHSVPTNAVRIEHSGSSLAYSADTGPGGGFPALASGADVVLCEAGLGGRRETASYAFHLTGAEAGAIAAEAGAGRLIVTHVAPSLPVDDVMAAAQAAFTGPVLLATPGLRVEI